MNADALCLSDAGRNIRVDCRVARRAPEIIHLSLRQCRMRNVNCNENASCVVAPIETAAATAVRRDASRMVADKEPKRICRASVCTYLCDAISSYDEVPKRMRQGSLRFSRENELVDFMDRAD